jgi:hypothetical protein
MQGWSIRTDAPGIRQASLCSVKVFDSIRRRRRRRGRKREAASQLFLTEMQPRRGGSRPSAFTGLLWQTFSLSLACPDVPSGWYTRRRPVVGTPRRPMSIHPSTDARSPAAAPRSRRPPSSAGSAARRRCEPGSVRMTDPCRAPCHPGILTRRGMVGRRPARIARPTRLKTCRSGDTGRPALRIASLTIRVAWVRMNAP